MSMPATLAELEARVIALEAEHVDYRAVIGTVNALSQQTRERLDDLDEKIDRNSQQLNAKIDNRFDALNGRMRSMEESMAEVKDLLVRALDNK